MFISKSKPNIASNAILSSNNPYSNINTFPFNKSYNTRVNENGNRKISNNTFKRFNILIKYKTTNYYIHIIKTFIIIIRCISSKA